MYLKKSDQELIDFIKCGNKIGGNELTYRYYHRVYSLALKIVGCPNDAYDIAQDVFCKVIGEKKILKFRGQCQLWSWLYRVTVNVCNVHFKKRKRLKETYYANGVFPEELEETIIINDASPEEYLIRKESVTHLFDSLGKLPEKYRKVIKKRYLEEKSYVETAGQLNISLDTLGVQLMRGKELLLRYYRRSWIYSKYHSNVKLSTVVSYH